MYLCEVREMGSEMRMSRVELQATSCARRAAHHRLCCSTRRDRSMHVGSHLARTRAGMHHITPLCLTSPSSSIPDDATSMHDDDTRAL